MVFVPRFASRKRNQSSCLKEPNVGGCAVETLSPTEKNHGAETVHVVVKSPNHGPYNKKHSALRNDKVQNHSMTLDSDSDDISSHASPTHKKGTIPDSDTDDSDVSSSHPSPTRKKRTVLDSDSDSDNSDDTSSPPSPVCIVRSEKIVKKYVTIGPVPKSIETPIDVVPELTKKAQNRWIKKVLDCASRGPSVWHNHSLRAPPTHAKFDNEKKVWLENAYRMPYQRQTCNVCKKKKTRTYCVCNVGDWLCKECHSVHILLKYTSSQSVSEKLINFNQKHEHKTAPKHAYMYSKDKQEWILSSENSYQKFKCRICRLEGRTKYCRTYCTCNPNRWMCYECHRNKHLLVKCPGRF